MRRVARCAVLCLLCIAEPVLHALGIPHPEGLSAQAANLLLTVGADDA